MGRRGHANGQGRAGYSRLGQGRTGAGGAGGNRAGQRSADGGMKGGGLQIAAGACCCEAAGCPCWQACFGVSMGDVQWLVWCVEGPV